MSTADTAEPAEATIPEGQPPPSVNGRPVLLDPDLDFIRAVAEQAGPTFKKCFQCGTCSSTCDLSPETDPFPRKEMAWAVWGLSDRLLRDVDVWLCHQCNDCTAECPRGGRPGDVLAAVRREQILAYSPPRFLARWVRQAVFAPALLGIAAILLTAVLLLRPVLEGPLGMTAVADTPISFPYSPPFPQWMLNLLFGAVALFSLAMMWAGVRRFWRALKSALPPERAAPPARGLWSSIGAALGNVVQHRDFTKCTKAKGRFLSHALVFYGFAALTVVTFFVITHRVNPLIRGEFIYPFAFFSPFKILANLGGLAVVIGCLIMLRDRFLEDVGAGRTTWYDWSLLWMILIVALTGFAVEILHYMRLEPHRHAAYFAHLLFILSLFLYLPYSKLAHLAYRVTALVFAEWSGRRLERPTGGES